MSRIKKGKTLFLAVVLVLALAQVAFAALQAVGPTLPDTDPTAGWSADYNGFPLWYRDTMGQTVTMLANPPLVNPLNPLAIPDPVIAGNLFSEHIGFGSEAMYWTCDASIPVPVGAGGGSADLIMALEAAFATGDAADNNQIVFQRIRIRIDTTEPGDYIVTTPYNTRTFTVLPTDVGNRAINDTVDVGAAVGVPSAALKGEVGPLLKQVGAPAGTLGDGTPNVAVENGPNGNIFRVQGPPGSAFGTIETNLFTTGSKLFPGTVFTVSRATLTRNATGTFADVFGSIPLPVTAGVAMTATVGAQAPAPMSQTGVQQFFARVPIAGAVPTQVTVNGTTNGVLPFSLNAPLKDEVHIRTANYSLSGQTLVVAAVSTDTQAALRAFGFVGATAAGQPINAAGNAVTFTGVTSPPLAITVKSSSGDTQVLRTFIVP